MEAPSTPRMRGRALATPRAPRRTRRDAATCDSKILYKNLTVAEVPQGASLNGRLCEVLPDYHSPSLRGALSCASFALEVEWNDTFIIDPESIEDVRFHSCCVRMLSSEIVFHSSEEVPLLEVYAGVASRAGRDLSSLRLVYACSKGCTGPHRFGQKCSPLDPSAVTLVLV
jgi:hypothetical protein